MMTRVGSFGLPSATAVAVGLALEYGTKLYQKAYCRLAGVTRQTKTQSDVKYVYHKQPFMLRFVLWNIALYARVSTKDKGQDHENQLRELRAFVERKASEGWTLVHEYVDKASAKTAERPAFRKMLEAASRKEYDMVLFWSLDRFSREGVLETLQHLKALTSHGVEWFSYREEYLRSIGPFRDAVLAILAAIAKQERVRLSE